MPELSLAQANRIIEASLARARALDLAPLSVAVLDAGGHLKAAQREDGNSFLRVRVAQAKAFGALALLTHSRHIAERYESDERQRGFIGALNDLAGGQVVPLPGGLLIRDAAGALLGAVGVAGAASEDDEACAVAGIEAIGLTVDPGA